MNGANMALTHDEALELLAFLITSAHGCLRESPDYGHYRLITAAERLARVWAPRCSGDTAVFLQELTTRTATEGAWLDAEPHRYMAYLAECCRAVAHEIKRRDGGNDNETEP